MRQPSGRSVPEGLGPLGHLLGLEALTQIGTDIVGVRGAVCAGGDRNKGRIQPELIRAFREAMSQSALAAA